MSNIWNKIGFYVKIKDVVQKICNDLQICFPSFFVAGKDKTILNLIIWIVSKTCELSFELGMRA